MDRARVPRRAVEVTCRAALIAFALNLAACQSEPYGHVVANKTQEAIEVIEQVDSTERDLGRVSPGLELPLNFYFGLDQCSRGILIARVGGRTGPELARRTEPLCYRDRWVVSEANPSG